MIVTTISTLTVLDGRNDTLGREGIEALPQRGSATARTATIKPLDDGGCPMNVDQQYPHELCTVSDAGPCSKRGNATVTPEDVGR
jgi:hypothetical protein